MNTRGVILTVNELRELEKQASLTEYYRKALDKISDVAFAVDINSDANLRVLFTKVLAIADAALKRD